MGLIWGRRGVIGDTGADVGVGVVGGYLGRRLGRLVVSRDVWGVGGGCFVTSAQEQEKAL